jgi:hypothetical protein
MTYDVRIPDQGGSMNSDLGPMPEPAVEPAGPNPGGVDAIDDPGGPPLVPDLILQPDYAT